MLSAMRFKSYVWPHNPRTFRAVWQRRVAVLDAPGGAFRVQELGRTCRVFRGEGEFCGPDAYDRFEALAEVFSENGAGALVHPVWGGALVYFTRLELTQEPRQDYVAYAFEFTEASVEDVDPSVLSSVTPVRAQFYMAKAGDTLWGIAERFGTDVQTLLELNPALANPNELLAGQKVAIS